MFAERCGFNIWFLAEVLIWPTTQASKCMNVEANNQTVSWFKAAQWEAAVQLLAEMRPLSSFSTGCLHGIMGQAVRNVYPHHGFCKVLFFINWAFSNSNVFKYVESYQVLILWFRCIIIIIRIYEKTIHTYIRSCIYIYIFVHSELLMFTRNC